mmetsp:Transcript_38444/g.85835  ORF Transcript_38444/g.85835 Transcript_38444/m.85835 type:complete len:190 (+) Transcript_38444:154-723(+)
METNLPVFTTLDEKVSETIMRDLRQVASKLKTVLIPREDQQGTLKQLKEWDLWGPLLVCLTLSVTLSLQAPEDQKALVFAGVFILVWLGAAVVTVNAQLLGGSISFFQSVCILGYCIFPLDVACFVCLLFKAIFSNLLVKMIVVGVGFIWSTRASVIFMGQIIASERRALAVYPVFFFYAFISWLILVS